MEKHVLLAFDKFKDALSAREACEAAAEGLRQYPEWTLDRCPLTDGGEGFCEILAEAGGGDISSIPVTGPRGARVQAALAMVPLAGIPPEARALIALPSTNHLAKPQGFVAVIEMAAASGLTLLAAGERDPWHATSFGTGELIQSAAAAGSSAILLGVGGSATNDLGLGALAALGLECRTEDGRLVDPPVPARWPEIVRLRHTLRPGLPPIRIACDVSNPLLGLRGSAAVYGAQKGLSHADLARMEAEMARIAALICEHFRQPAGLTDLPGAGAAGGIAFGLMAGASAQILSGFELVAAWLNLKKRIAAADLVLTGEGRFDASSFAGKGPGAIATEAMALGKSVEIFAGQVAAAPTPPGTARIAVHTITPPAIPLDDALRGARENLVRAVHHTFARP